MYHSGATDDLHNVIEHFSKDYEEIALVGFSLGGNLVLKYAGENPNELDQKISKVIAISVPVDLHAGSLNISKKSNFIYQKSFLNSLTDKLKEKKQQYPEAIDLDLLKKVKTLFDFDDYFTGPLHGFESAADYYAKCNSKQFLHQIKRPALIINAIDDPFLPEECYPYQSVLENEYLNMLTPQHGGHVGFVEIGKKFYWVEQQINNFLNKKSES